MQVRLEQISKMYQTASQSVTALSDVELSLQPGDFIAICGPSGCGKSTLLMILGGLLQPDRGHVWIGGQDLYALSEPQRARLRSETHGFVFQQFHLIPYLSVWDNVLSARIGAATSLPASEIESRAESLLMRLNLSHRRDHLPGQLSTGEKQRTALARALLNQPRILLADEPTGNLDREHAAQVIDYLTEFAKAGGMVVLVTHDPWAAQQAQQIWSMESGSLVMPSPTREEVTR